MAWLRCIEKVRVTMSAASMVANRQLRVLTLQEGFNGEATIYRLEKGWKLHFVLGPSLAEKRVNLFVNHPAEGKYGPDRHEYREIFWQNLSDSKFDVYDNFAEVNMVLAGSFNYFFTIDGSDIQSNANGSGYFLVDPVLTVGKYDERVPLDCIACQSVLSKNLGPSHEWLVRLQVAKECEYNMLHFTPMQELGASNSAYCLSNQLLLNPSFTAHDQSRKFEFTDVKKLVDFIHTDWDMLSITDLVFNHTANESYWIQTHPECTYNMVNSPYLKPAYLLDRIIWHFSLEIGEGKWMHCGIPPELSSEDHLNAMRHTFLSEVLPKHNIHEYFLLQVDDVVQEFKMSIMDGHMGQAKPDHDLAIEEHPNFVRNRASVDIHHAVIMYNVDHGPIPESERVERCCDAFRQRLQQLNDARYGEVQSHLHAATTNMIANARWRFIDPNGEQLGTVGPKKPIMWNYFILPDKLMSVEEEEAVMHTDRGAFCMAHNGWVMGDDPMRNFAEQDSNVYLRRELIPWGDSVKLRYGRGPADCPFLWNHMLEYVSLTASIFHGVRLDNCHSTPIHVAEYFLDEAREIRPDLYVIAELFTSSEEKDNIFINRLGLNSLIREALAAGDSHDQGRLVHRYGGLPVGAFIQPTARPLAPTVAHAIFFDQTHDNLSPVEKRTALDVLPSAALVAMACCATGSNRGYDEMVPHHINVVTEERLYQSWVEKAPKALSVGEVCTNTGIFMAKKALNKLHYLLGHAGYTQVYVDQVNKDIVSVTRHCPVSHTSVIMVARTVFNQPDCMHTGSIAPLWIPGKEIVLEEIVLEAKLTTPNSVSGEFKKDDKVINGLTNYQLYLKEHIKVNESTMVAFNGEELEFINFPPGSIIALKVCMKPAMKNRVLKLRQTLSVFGYRMRTFSARKLNEITASELEGIVSSLNFNDLNRVLYRSDNEGLDDNGVGVYQIPNWGAMPYCGLQGLISLLSSIRPNNELGHPLCDNLRHGNWLLYYVADRLKAYPGTEQLGNWFTKTFEPLCDIPRYLIPSYFDAIITGVVMLVEEVVWAKMSPFISNGATFVRALALGSVQFCSFVKSALLPPLSPMLQPPFPPTQGGDQQACLTLAAGLPHFASGIFRNWGRDTFISMRGLLLLTGRFQEARYLLLGFAGTLRHGLIPNLLGSGTHARYNCRDAVWWWLECVQQYVREAPDGEELLNDRVARMYPVDETVDIPKPGTADQPLHLLMQEALQCHATGTSFRERNAGRQIDNDMCDKGFDSVFGVDWKTGFVFGGTEDNCGTWMDKMGSSEKAGNKGKPATPRDGSAVELIGLCKSTVGWLEQLHCTGKYPYDGVVNSQNEKVTWLEWGNLIQLNFEKMFFVPPSEAAEPGDELINRRGIYKDCLGASRNWTDYQLRPNQAVTMVLAPELFKAENAWMALTMMKEVLMGPLGMRSLDPSDFNYNGDYVNSNDSDDFKLANGLNYHQGPEWLWPVGYFLRALLHFAQRMEKEHEVHVMADTVTFIKTVMSRHRVHVMSSPWRSLPELTNKNGAVCRDSCEAQAWSVSCLLELLYDMEMLAEKSRKELDIAVNDILGVKE